MYASINKNVIILLCHLMFSIMLCCTYIFIILLMTTINNQQRRPLPYVVSWMCILQILGIRKKPSINVVYFYKCASHSFMACPLGKLKVSWFPTFTMQSSFKYKVFSCFIVVFTGFLCNHLLPP